MGNFICKLGTYMTWKATFPTVKYRETRKTREDNGTETAELMIYVSAFEVLTGLLWQAGYRTKTAKRLSQHGGCILLL